MICFMGFWIFVLYLITFLLLFFPLILILTFILNRRAKKRKEDEYFRRLYWTVRQAQEDANKHKDNND